MTKKYYISIIAAFAIVAIATGIYLSQARSKANNPSDATALKIVDVDEVVGHPESFKGSVGVSGKVIKADASLKSFTLGCDDACVMVPVTYQKQLPEPGSQVVVYGEIKKSEEGKYFLEGQRVEVR